MKRVNEITHLVVIILVIAMGMTSIPIPSWADWPIESDNTPPVLEKDPQKPWHKPNEMKLPEGAVVELPEAYRIMDEINEAEDDETKLEGMRQLEVFMQLNIDNLLQDVIDDVALFIVSYLDAPNEKVRDTAENIYYRVIHRASFSLLGDIVSDTKSPYIAKEMAVGSLLWNAYYDEGHERGNAREVINGLIATFEILVYDTNSPKELRENSVYALCLIGRDVNKDAYPIIAKIVLDKDIPNEFKEYAIDIVEYSALYGDEVAIAVLSYTLRLGRVITADIPDSLKKRALDALVAACWYSAEAPLISQESLQIARTTIEGHIPTLRDMLIDSTCEQGLIQSCILALIVIGNYSNNIELGKNAWEAMSGTVNYDVFSQAINTLLSEGKITEEMLWSIVENSPDPLQRGVALQFISNFHFIKNYIYLKKNGSGDKGIAPEEVIGILKNDKIPMGGKIVIFNFLEQSYHSGLQCPILGIVRNYGKTEKNAYWDETQDKNGDGKINVEDAQKICTIPITEQDIFKISMLLNAGLEEGWNPGYSVKKLLEINDIQFIVDYLFPMGGDGKLGFNDAISYSIFKTVLQFHPQKEKIAQEIANMLDKYGSVDLFEVVLHKLYRDVFLKYVYAYLSPQTKENMVRAAVTYLPHAGSYAGGFNNQESYFMLGNLVYILDSSDVEDYHKLYTWNGLLSAKDKDGNYIIDDNLANSLILEKVGRENNADGIVGPLIASGRGYQFIPKLNIDIDVVNHIFYSAVALAETDETADQFLKDCVAQGLITEHEISVVRDIRSIKTFEEMRAYVLDSEGKIKPIIKIGWVAVVRSGFVGRLYNEITDQNQREYFMEYVKPGELTKYRHYYGDPVLSTNFACNSFTIQAMFNYYGIPEGIDTDRLTQYPDVSSNLFIPQDDNIYNMKVYVVRLHYGTVMHFVCGIFTGNDINNAEERNNFSNWMFWDPQSNDRKYPGSKGFETGMKVYIAADKNYNPTIPTSVFYSFIGNEMIDEDEFPEGTIILDIPNKVDGAVFIVSMHFVDWTSPKDLGLSVEFKNETTGKTYSYNGVQMQIVEFWIRDDAEFTENDTFAVIVKDQNGQLLYQREGMKITDMEVASAHSRYDNYWYKGIYQILVSLPLEPIPEVLE